MRFEVQKKARSYERAFFCTSNRIRTLRKSADA
jgi:hypothetical protein